MVYSNGQEGVLVGSHKVWVELSTAGAKDDKEQQKRLAQQQGDPEIGQILKKYGKAENTPITLEITKSQDVKPGRDPHARLTDRRVSVPRLVSHCVRARGPKACPRCAP
jgi:hypothetical protein